MISSSIVVQGAYDLRLVLLSYLVAVMASYAALDLAARITASQGQARRIWLIGGAATMGLGVWTMHFIGMLAFELPIAMEYTLPLVALSLLIAIAASGLALFVASRRTLTFRSLLLGGLCMGSGITAMHYTGMAAMVISGTVSYDPFWLVASMVIAVAASMAALWLAFNLRTESARTRRGLGLKLGSALVMGAAIVGMHYAGMTAAIFSATPIARAAMVNMRMDPNQSLIFGLVLGIATLIILGFVLLSALVDKRFSTQTATFESLFINSTDAIYTLDRDGALQRGNPAALQMIGALVQTATVGNLRDLIAPAHADQFAAQLSLVVQGEPQQGEYSLIAAHDQHMIGHVTLVPIRIGDQILGVFSIIRDITARRQAEDAMRQQRDLYERLLHGISDLGEGVIVVKAQQIVFANDAFCRISGYTQAELAALSSVDVLFTPTDRAALAYHLDTHTTGGRRGGRFESGVLHTHGQRIPVEIASEQSQDDRTAQRILLFRDITERKVAETELAAASVELERAVRRATELAAVAESANHAKSAFLANMSHEIRTPMNGIIGMTGLLLDTLLTSEQHEFVETIRTSSEALLTIINDILDFSKIESGKMELEQHPFDVRDCVESALDLLAPRAAEKQLDLAYLIDQNVPATIVGDVTRLRQILVNLLSNAIKFTERGEVVVTIQVERFEADAPILHMAIRDTGIGIPPDRMDRLFRSFSQADTSTTRQYGGTGLGLAISKRLSELMGGTMWVESIPNQGSTFHVTFCAAVAPSQPRMYLRGAIPELKGKHLLIVDDNATNRRILMLQAESWGMHAQAVASGQEALALVVQSERFDIAILDMQMPGMDGVQLAEAIRRHLPAQQLPLILLTSLGRRAEDSLTGLFAAALTKPVKSSQLYDALIEIVHATPLPKRQKIGLPVFDAHMAERLPLHILLAEDNAINQKVALRTLERLGYRADVAANGLEVLDALARQHYDVVLMDVQMPELDGLETTHRIRSECADELQPYIIAMTANAIQGDREECLAAGMDAYLSKPVRAEALVQALEILKPHAPMLQDTREVTQAPELPLLDRDVTVRLQDELGGGDPTFVIDLIDLFFTESHEAFQAMHQALAHTNARNLERAAHTLKSTSTLLGMRQLAACCSTIEEHAVLQLFEDSVALLHQAEVSYEQTAHAIQQLRTEMAPYS